MRLPFRSLALHGLLLAGSLHAQTYNWTGGPSGTFEDSANWTPTPSFDNFNSTYIVDGPISTHFEPLGAYMLGDLYLKGGASLAIEGEATTLYVNQLYLQGNATGPRATLTLGYRDVIQSVATSGFSVIANADVTLNDGSQLVANGLQIGGDGETNVVLHEAVIASLSENTAHPFVPSTFGGGVGSTTRFIFGSPLGQAPVYSNGFNVRFFDWYGVSGGTNQIIFNHTATDEAPCSLVARLRDNIDIIQQAGSSYLKLWSGDTSEVHLNPITVNGGHLILESTNAGYFSKGDVVVNAGKLSLVGGIIARLTVKPGALVSTDPPSRYVPNGPIISGVSELLLNGDLQLRGELHVGLFTVNGTAPVQVNFAPGHSALDTDIFGVLKLNPFLAPDFDGNFANIPNRVVVVNIANVTGSPAADLTLNVTFNSFTGGLRKTGDGTLVLNIGFPLSAPKLLGDNFIDSGTVVSNGHFVWERGTLGDYIPGGTYVGSTEVSGTLAGDDYVDQSTRLKAGGHVAPGTPFGLVTGRPQDLLTGRLVFKNGLTLDGGSFLDFDLGTASDSIGVGGLFFGPSTGLVTLNLSDSGGLAPGSLYTLISFGANSGVDLSDFTFGNVVPGYQYDLQLNGNSLQVAVNVPEPSTALLLVSAVVLGMATSRPRRPR